MIKLRHMEQVDTNNVCKYITNTAVTKFLTWEPYKEAQKIKEYFKYAMKCKKFPDEIFCITFNNEIIGTSHMVFRGNKDVQIGFGILPEFWNQGLGYKISIKIIQHIVNSSEWSKKVSRISVVIHNKNIYALKIFAKLGFSLETKNIKDNFDKYTFFLQNNDVPK